MSPIRPLKIYLFLTWKDHQEQRTASMTALHAPKAPRQTGQRASPSAHPSTPRLTRVPYKPLAHEK